MGTLERLDDVAEVMHQASAPAPVLYAVEAAAAILAGDRDDAAVVYIPLPKALAARFPDPVVHAHAHQPHVTVCFIKGGEMSGGEQSAVLQAVRRAARRVAPFEIVADPHGGLKDFGPGDSGEKALWIPVRSDPRGELERLHRVVRMALEEEGLPCEAHARFTGHVTWRYAPNSLSDDDRRREDALVSDRFPDGLGWDVRSVMMSLPRGERLVTLSPVRSPDAGI